MMIVLLASTSPACTYSHIGLLSKKSPANRHSFPKETRLFILHSDQASNSPAKTTAQRHTDTLTVTRSRTWIKTQPLSASQLSRTVTHVTYAHKYIHTHTHSKLRARCFFFLYHRLPFSFFSFSLSLSRTHTHIHIGTYQSDDGDFNAELAGKNEPDIKICRQEEKRHLSQQLEGKHALV